MCMLTRGSQAITQIIKNLHAGQMPSLRPSLPVSIPLLQDIVTEFGLACSIGSVNTVKEANKHTLPV